MHMGRPVVLEKAEAMHGCEAEKRLAARKAMTPTAVVWRPRNTN
jgi:hypothetical protein